MTQERAETVANVVLAAIAVGAAYQLMRDPVLRRRVWDVVRRSAIAAGPWLLAETRQAWVDTRTPANATGLQAHGETTARDMIGA
jgi:hypothetical protein